MFVWFRWADNHFVTCITRLPVDKEELSDEEEIEVDQREFNGITYYVNESNNNIHHLDCDEDDEHYGEVIGTWTEDGPQINEEWKNKNN